MSSYSYFLSELVLCCSVFLSIFCLVSSLNVSPLPELFGKPWLVAIAHMNANHLSETTGGFQPYPVSDTAIDYTAQSWSLYTSIQHTDMYM